MRAPIEVLKAVRHKVGPDFPVICRLSADEYVEEGLRLEASKEIAGALEKNGANALHISACVAASVYLNHPPYYVEEGVFAHLAQGIKSVVNIPVITVGRIRTPELANRILEEKKADLVSMGRALIADPDLPAKAFAGRREDIIPCISCNRCIVSIRKGALQCAVNPETGREGIFIVKKTTRPKKVWIIGGGPAGMIAAEIAARRGHQVTLYEKENRLGGQFLLAAVPPQKQVLQEFVEYLARQLGRLSVKVVKGKLFEPSLLEEERPEVAILATGARPFLPPIEGIREAATFSTWEALSKPMSLGRRVLVIGGGGIGAEVADYLSEKGKKVTLIEMREGIALDLPVHLQHFLNLRLQSKGVEVRTLTKAVRFEKDGLWIEDSQGTRKLEVFDSTVMALGSAPNDELANPLKERISEVFVVGDAARPRELMEALAEAAEAALKI